MYFAFRITDANSPRCIRGSLMPTFTTLLRPFTDACKIYTISTLSGFRLNSKIWSCLAHLQKITYAGNLDGYVTHLGTCFHNYMRKCIDFYCKYSTVIVHKTYGFCIYNSLLILFIIFYFCMNVCPFIVIHFSWPKESWSPPFGIYIKSIDIFL